MKILVVHRQKEVIEQIKSVLDSGNVFINSSDSGLDGLLISRIEKFDLIICGTDLPVVTGFELVRTIRNNSINKTTTVIFLADQVEEKTEHLAQALGVAGIVGHSEFSDKLALLIHDYVQVEPDKIWKSLVTNDPSN